MEFPIIRINSSKWLDSEELIPLFEEYMYTSKYEIYKDYYFNKEFVDCRGDVYKVIARKLPTSFWRNVFKFLPGIYKVKLEFKSMNRKIELAELKNDIVEGIKRFDTEATKETSEEWIKVIMSSNSIKEVLSGEKE